jgi:hypothetical protein
MGFRSISPLLLVGGVAIAGCNCSRLEGKADSFAFTRCAQVDPPEERSLKVGALELEIRERLLTVRGPAELRIAAFAGPVGAPFSRTDLAQLAAARAALFLFLGGLGDTHETASANLAALASLHVPTLFVAGGADRLPVVEAAFEELDAPAAQTLIHASGLREVRLGRERFALVPGAALGRYALDDEGCGFEQDDLDNVEGAISDAKEKGRVWLLAWNAPAGWGITRGYGDTEVGSTELAKLAQALGAQGGLFAYPEAQVFSAGKASPHGGLALVVPRLARTGAQRADGGRIPRALVTLSIGEAGLVPAP